MSNENFKLDREIDAAKLLLTSLADILEGDEQFAADLIEGETSLNEAIQSAVELYCRDKTFCDAIDIQISLLETRKARLEKRMSMTRVLVGTALDVAGKKKVETPLGTATMKATQASLILDDEEEHLIPTEYWKRSDPKLDRAAIKADLKKGKAIPGARLSNGGSTVQFTFK